MEHTWTSVQHGEHLNGYSKRKIFKRILKTAAEESRTCQSFRDRWLTSTDESVLGDGLFTSAAVLRLLERLHPECVGMKRLQLLRLQKAKQQQKTKEVLKCCDLTGLQWVQVLWVIGGIFIFFCRCRCFAKEKTFLVHLKFIKSTPGCSHKWHKLVLTLISDLTLCADLYRRIRTMFYSSKHHIKPEIIGRNKIKPRGKKGESLLFSFFLSPSSSLFCPVISFPSLQVCYVTLQKL